MATDSSITFNDDFGFVYERRQTGPYAMEEIWFQYADVLKEIDAVAYGVDADGTVTRCTTLIAEGDTSSYLSYNYNDGFWYCACPFNSCAYWLLFLWRRNTSLSKRDLTWDDESTSIPVDEIVDEVNLLRARANEVTTSSSRSLRVPEFGSNEYFLPPADSRAGHFLGFDDNGNPAVCYEVADYVTFMEQIELAKSYMEAAKSSAADALVYAGQSESWANESKTYMNAAANSASEAQSAMNTAKAYLQQFEQVASEAIIEVDEASKNAVSTVNSLVAGVVEECKYANQMAHEWATSAETSATAAAASADEAKQYARVLTEDFRVEVYAEKPDKLESGVLYMIGDDTDGYDVYVKDANNKTVYLYHTPYGLQPATQSEYGLVKLSASGVEWTLDTGAQAIGVDVNGQLRARTAGVDRCGAVRPSYTEVLSDQTYRGLIGMGQGEDGSMIFNPVASTSTFGVVKLGAEPHFMNATKYAVPISAHDSGGSTHGDTDGQLFFNLKTGGALSYSNSVLDVATGSYDTRGVLYLLDSLDPDVYSDEQIEACRYTHAASVALVLDAVDDFGEKYFTEERIGGFFDDWARSKDLAEQIWNNDDYRGELITILEENIVGNAIFNTNVNTYVSEITNKWLVETITQEFLFSMFEDSVKSWTSEAVDTYWTDKIKKTVHDFVEEEVGEQLYDGIKDYMSDEKNMDGIANKVSGLVVSSVAEQASQAAVSYLQQFIQGEVELYIDGEWMTFRKYVNNFLTENTEGYFSSLTTKLENFEAQVNLKITSRGVGSSSSSIVKFSSNTNIDISNYDVLVINTSGTNGYTSTIYCDQLKAMYAALQGSYGTSTKLQLNPYLHISTSGEKNHDHTIRSIWLTMSNDHTVTIENCKDASNIVTYGIVLSDKQAIENV